MCARCPTIHHCSTVPGVKYKYLSPAVSISPQQQPGCHCYTVFCWLWPGPLDLCSPHPSAATLHLNLLKPDHITEIRQTREIRQAGWRRQHCSWLDNIIGVCECLTPQLVRVLLAWLVCAAGRQTHENIQTSYQQSASQRRFSWDHGMRKY